RTHPGGSNSGTARVRDVPPPCRSGYGHYLTALYQFERSVFLALALLRLGHQLTSFTDHSRPISRARRMTAFGSNLPVPGEGGVGLESALSAHRSTVKKGEP